MPLMDLRRLPALLLPSLVLLTVLGGCGSGGDGVASVNGHPIELATFRHWLSIVAAESGEPAAGLPEPPLYAGCIRRRLAEAASDKSKPTTAALRSSCAARSRALTQATLGFLISTDWLLGEAQDLGIAMPDTKVKKEFLSIEHRQFAHPAEFERFLSTGRYTVSDLLLRVKVGLLSDAIKRRVVKEHSHVTAAELERYYTENKARFGTPEKRSVYVILTKTEHAAESARRDIESGRSFTSVARNASLDRSGKTSGGLLSDVGRGRLAKALDEAVFATRPNLLTGPIKTTAGYYVFSVKSIAPANEPPLSKVESQVKAQLTFANESKALNTFIKEFRTRWTKATECKSGYVVMQCSDYRASRAE